MFREADAYFLCPWNGPFYSFIFYNQYVPYLFPERGSLFIMFRKAVRHLLCSPGRTLFITLLDGSLFLMHNKTCAFLLCPMSWILVSYDSGADPYLLSRSRSRFLLIALRKVDAYFTYFGQMLLSCVPRGRCVFIMLHPVDAYLSYSARQMLICYAPQGGRLSFMLLEADPYYTPQGECMSLAPPTTSRNPFLLKKWMLYPLHIRVYIYLYAPGCGPFHFLLEPSTAPLEVK